MNHIPSRVNVALLSAGHFLNDFYCNFLPILLPVIIPQLGLSLTLSGLLIMVMSITSNLLQPVFGYIMDKHDWRRLLVPVLPFGAICICTIRWWQHRLCAGPAGPRSLHRCLSADITALADPPQHTAGCHPVPEQTAAVLHHPCP